MKPLIGINLDIKKGPPEEASIQTTYTDSILKSGGLPVLLPPMPAADLKYIVHRLDGILLIGGADYCPTLYNEEPDATVELAEPRRQEFDLAVARLALAEEDMPVLGICLGCQLINILQGGSLVQDIKSAHPHSQVEHSSKDGWKNGFVRHSVELVAGSKISAIFKNQKFEVPTSHHQSVKQVGHGLFNTGHNVQDKSIVTTTGAISVEFDSFALVNQMGKFMNGQIWALSWPKDCEKTQTDYLQTKGMVSGKALQLIGSLGGCIG